ncbi:transcriptional regulator [Xanthomonas fragariae]|uniref:Transcriptional regulator n=1 Tax=Xanthomonas fragariae TaxID=48664 RepID=A0A1Y6HEL2_9XANT|nr:hypothetical protein PD885_02602 [Xanthomonas fragariae]SMR02714.1 transcriptional regulator [Xanthomonas fragariae]
MTGFDACSPDKAIRPYRGNASRYDGGRSRMRGVHCSVGQAPWKHGSMHTTGFRNHCVRHGQPSSALRLTCQSLVDASSVFFEAAQHSGKARTSRTSLTGATSSLQHCRLNGRVRPNGNAAAVDDQLPLAAELAVIGPVRAGVVVIRLMTSRSNPSLDKRCQRASPLNARVGVRQTRYAFAICAPGLRSIDHDA